MITDSLSMKTSNLNCKNDLFSASGAAQSSSKVVLVFIVGGYTLAEVAAFRLLQANTGLQFIIAGTSNISGQAMMKSIISWLFEG